MTNNNGQFEEDIIDLTELIESGDRGDGRASPKPKSPPDDDFSSILNDQTGAAGENFDPDEQLDMSGMGGIDNLLESLDIPPQPRAGAKQAATPPGDELDSVLDDLLASTPPKQAGAAMPELNMPPPASPAQASETSGLDADLDDLLSSFDEPRPKKKAPAPVAEPDDLLGGDAPAAVAKSKAVAPDIGLDDLLGDSTSDHLAKDAQAAHEDAVLAADLDDILGEVELPRPSQPAPPADEELTEEQVAEVMPGSGEEMPEEPLPDVDEVEETAQASEAPIEPEPEPEPVPEPEPESEPKPQPLDSDKIDEPVAGAEETGEHEEPAELEDLLDNEAASASVARDLPSPRSGAEPALAAAAQGNQPVPVQSVAWTPEALIGICHNLASGESAQQSLQKFSRELGQQSAHVEDMGDQLAQLGKRMLACESKLSAARARIAGLEKSFESAAAFEDLLRDGSPLHAGFMALISTAVSNSLKGFALSGTDGAIQKHMARLEANVEIVDKRLTDLEERLRRVEQALPQGETDLEQEIAKLITSNENSDIRIGALEKKVRELVAESSEKMEKAAASIVARILQEEISKLLQE